MQRGPWRRFAAPAAFLLAATIAVLLIRSGLRSGATTTTAAVRTTTAKEATTTRPRATTTTRTTKTTSGPRFWTVRAGDTFAVISAKTGVPVATIERLNPNVKSTSLFIGERLRLR
jgi:LysM repeat protein